MNDNETPITPASGAEPTPSPALTDPLIDPTTDSVATPSSPASSSNPFSTTTSTTTEPLPSATPAPKKSKVGLIVAAIAGVLVIAGGVFAFLWYTGYTKPEAVALDAMTKFLGQKNIQTTGNISVTFSEPTLGLTAIDVDLEASSSIIPSASKGTITLHTEEDELALSMENVIVTDGTIYFQFDGLTEVLETTLPSAIAPIVDYFESELTSLDGQWYELDVVEIAALAGATISTADYDCAIDALKSLNTDSSRTAFQDGYTAHPFVSIEKTANASDLNGGTPYRATFNSDAISSFLAFLADDTTALDPIVDCIGGTGSIDASDVANSIVADPSYTPDFPTIDLFVSTWGHELKAATITESSGYMSFAASLEFSYPATIEILAPENSAPFSGFLEDFIKKLSSMTEDALSQGSIDTDTETDTEVEETTN